jgi:hypothetical protein
MFVDVRFPPQEILQSVVDGMLFIFKKPIFTAYKIYWLEIFANCNLYVEKKCRRFYAPNVHCAAHKYKLELNS